MFNNNLFKITFLELIAIKPGLISAAALQGRKSTVPLFLEYFPRALCCVCCHNKNNKKQEEAEKCRIFAVLNKRADGKIIRTLIDYWFLYSRTVESPLRQ